MAKVKFNVKGVESGGDRPLPKPGVYRCKITTCVDAKPTGKDRRLEVVYTITDGDHKGFPIYDYINLESEAAAWKLAQFLEAVGLATEKKRTGEFDPEELVGTALSVKTKIQPETDQFAASVKANVLMPLDGTEGEASDEDLSDDEDDETEEQDYSAMDVDELSSEAEERELDVEAILKGKKSAKTKKAALIAALEEDDESDEDDDAEDGDDDSDDEDDETYSEEELTELDDDDLVDVAFGYVDEDEDEIEGILDEDEKDEYVTVKGKGKKAKTTVDRDALIARILEAQDEDDDEDDDDDVDYDAMDIKDLKALAKERGINEKGSKKVLIARLQKDDEPF